jgi:glyoxylase-like metal-dependent hydrolase (beta-lactamase superfamily II)
MITLSRRGVLAGAAAALATPRLLTVTGAWAQESPAPVAPLVYPRKVGELEVAAISDGYIEFAGLPLVNIDEQEMKAALTAAFIDPAAPIRLGVTAHLVRGGGRTVLIDTGAADTFGTTLGRLPAALAALGVQPADVQAVLLTHMHPDHLGGLLAGDAPALPNATVHVDETDLAFWTDEATAAQAPKDFQPFFARARATATAYGDRIQPFAGETELLPGVTSVPLPGHTVGHTGFRLAAGDDEIIVFGDTAHSSAVQFAHPEASFAFDTDPAQAAESRKRFFDMVTTNRTLVACTHLPFPGVGHVARAGDAYAWVPEHWHYM